MLFIGYTLYRLFHEYALYSALSQYEELFFYVDNALMIISWKRYVRIIHMQNIILFYVVAVGSRPPPPFLLFFLYSLSIGYQCHTMMSS